jgi:hypothetical protein
MSDNASATVLVGFRVNKPEVMMLSVVMSKTPVNTAVVSKSYIETRLLPLAEPAKSVKKIRLLDPC